MARINWDQNYNTGIDYIDEQHQGLLNILNDLHDTLLLGKGSRDVKDTIDRLKNYANIHFKSEEDLFEKYKYPAAEKHINEHEYFIRKVEEFKADLENKKITVLFDMINFLKDWIIVHILASDQDYGQFLRQRGVI